jgi:hypothetical protein
MKGYKPYIHPVETVLIQQCGRMPYLISVCIGPECPLPIRPGDQTTFAYCKARAKISRLKLVDGDLSNQRSLHCGAGGVGRVARAGTVATVAHWPCSAWLKACAK